MTPNSTTRDAAGPRKNWRQIVAKYQTPDMRASMWQLVSSLVAYAGLFVLMYFSLQVSYLLTLLLAIPAAGFMVRIFIIFHDCGHQSFFASRKLNDLVGAITGVITFTPYYRWRHAHAIHHATAGDLDRRETGDIWTMTVAEYQAASKAKRISYRIYRNPVVIFPMLFASVGASLQSQRQPPHSSASFGGLCGIYPLSSHSLPVATCPLSAEHVAQCSSVRPSCHSNVASGFVAIKDRDTASS